MPAQSSPGKSAGPTPGAGWSLVLFSFAVSVVIAALIAVAPAERRIKAVQLKAKAVTARDAKHARQALAAEVRQRFAQGVAMLQLREYSHAITAFHRVLALDPKIPEAHVNMGFAYLGLVDHVGAQRFFEGALALAPQTANAHYGLALTQAAQGRLPAAVDAMRRYLAFAAADDPFRGQGEARLAEMMGRLSESAAGSTAQRVPEK